MRGLPTNGEKNPRNLAAVVNRVIQGGSNANGEVTLTTSSATTTVTGAHYSKDSTVIMFPMTANAATEFVSGSLYISDISNGSFTITHVNSATADRTFRYLVIGG
jgi:hypothetical protein